MDADEMTCPACAETVKAAANICKHCGVDLATGLRPTVAAPPTKTSSIGKGCLGVVGIVIALTVIGLMVGEDKTKPSSDAASDAASVPVMNVKATELSAAFQQNEAKAKLAYDGKALRITGVVKAIDLDFADKPVIRLQGANDQLNMGISEGGKMTDVDIAGLSSAQAAKIEQGQTLIVTCTSIGEVMGSAQASDCQLE